MASTARDNIARLVGKRGFGLWGKRNPVWYACVVKAVNADGTLKVQWDEDGRYTFQFPMEKFHLWCAICCDNMALDKLVVLDCCTDVFCQACLKRWLMDRENMFKRTAECPSCQQAMSEKDVVAVLGRSYQPAEPALRKNEPIPQDLQKWLDDNDGDCKQCDNCGIFIQREEGCDAMMCLCGYRFCWLCMVSAEDDEGCDCDHCQYYDNVRGFDTEELPPLATLEDLVNLKAFHKAWVE